MKLAEIQHLLERILGEVSNAAPFFLCLCYK